MSAIEILTSYPNQKGSKKYHTYIPRPYHVGNYNYYYIKKVGFRNSTQKPRVYFGYVNKHYVGCVTQDVGVLDLKREKLTEKDVYYEFHQHLVFIYKRGLNVNGISNIGG